MTKYVPDFKDSETMTDIHSRMHGLISRAIPMNFRDEENLNDLLIPGQDEAYECGRKRGAKEAIQPWRSLSDSEWVNIVNHPKVLGDGFGQEAAEAVAEAFKLIEAKIRELNEFQEASHG